MFEPSLTGELRDALARFRPARVLVYGDIMLDEFLFGRAERLSPEKPVPVVRFEDREVFLGGAGNVVRNLQEMGCIPVLVGVVGDDREGQVCRSEMEAAGLVTDGLVSRDGGKTPLKLRVHAGQHALVRIDFEDPEETDGDEQQELISAIRRQAPRCQAAIVSDYRKGSVTGVGVAALREALGDAPIVVDPKGTDPEIYRGADFLLPNEAELVDLTGREWSDETAQELKRKLGLEALVLTRSEKGVRLYGADEPEEYEARARQVFDVTGAGDTFAATFTALVASGEVPGIAARLANVAAGIKVRKVGTATVSREEIDVELARDVEGRDKRIDLTTAARIARERKLRGECVVFTNGCFDLLHAGHIKYLEASRALGDCLIVGLNADSSVKRLKGADRPILDESERSEILSALSCVDYVVLFDEDTPVHLIEAIQPDVLTKGADYQRDQIVGADLVETLGGRVERIELVTGKSTTRIVERITELSRE